MMRWLLIGLVALGAAGCESTKRSVDVYDRAVHVITHWDEVKGEELCAQTFCRRTDTTNKYVGGKRGYSSEESYDYCPIHDSKFTSTGSRIDGLLRFVHFAWAFTLSVVIAAIVLSLLAAPFVAVARAIQRKRGRPDFGVGDVAGGIGGIVGLIVAIAAYVLFFWF